MKIITFNIQNNFLKKENDKKDKLIDFINKENPDIICFQELTYNLKKYIEDNILNYNLIGISRYQTNSLIDEYNSILIKNDIKILNSQTFSLYTKHKHDYFSVFPRICTYVKLQKNNQIFQIYNTHLDHLFNYTRKKQLDVLKKYLYNIEQIPTIITGDFNMNKNNKIIKEFLNTNFINTGFALKTPTLRHFRTLPIDYIITTKNIHCKSIKANKKVCLSDHYPLIAKLKIND